MKRAYLLASIFAIYSACSAAETTFLQNLVGAWGTEESLFLGDELMKGEAIYIDGDGRGALLGGGGEEPISSVRLEITSYDSASNVITFRLVRKGKVLAADMKLVYDQKNQWLIFKDEHFYHRYDIITAKMGKILGLRAGTGGVR